MSDKEIVKLFHNMDGRESTRVRILAELNGCEKKYIEAALADAGIKIKKPGRKKQPEQKLSRSQERRQQEQKKNQEQTQQAAGAYPDIVVSAVKARMRDLEERVTRWNEKIDAAMEEWAKLKEWFTEYGDQATRETI